MEHLQRTAKISTPKQERSQRTLSAIVEAASAGISTNGFEQTSIAEICREAQVTSGAFYARFSGKDELLFLLIDELRAEIVAVVGQLSISQKSVDRDLNTFFLKMLGLYRRKAGLIYALLSQAYRNKEFAHELRALNSEIYLRLEAIFSEWNGARSSKSFRISLRLALLATLGTLRDVAQDQLFLADGVSVPDTTVATEMKKLFKGYTGIK